MHEDLATPYHQQDTNYYCGAACAQMVIDSVGGGLLDQDDLYADNHSHSTTESGWYTAPDGLTWTLNNRQSSKYFVLDALSTEDAISRMIAWTIHHYGVGPVAMVFGSAHWIVVRGYTASAAPKSSADTGYSITGFDVNNPWPPTPMPGPPPPHADPDVCGSGGTRGVADEHLAYATWQADYMTGIDFGHWNGKFVAVCDPDPPPGPGPVVREKRRARQGARLIGRKQATESALRGLQEHGLTKRKQWAAALKSVTPGEAVLVQRLDRLDSFYWIVPLQRRRAQVPAAVSVDARSGEYRQAIVLPKPDEAAAFEAPKTEAVLESIAGRRFELPDRLGRLLVRPEAVCVHPTLVWRPCRESLSPFYPFRMVTVGAHRLYVRLDGAVFTSLTLGQHGI
jgi:hypothetical protein